MQTFPLSPPASFAFSGGVGCAVERIEEMELGLTKSVHFQWVAIGFYGEVRSGFSLVLDTNRSKEEGSLS